MCLVVIRAAEVLSTVVGCVMFVAGAPWYISLAITFGWMALHTFLYYFFHDGSAIWSRQKDAEAGNQEEKKTDGVTICSLFQYG